MWIKEGYMYKFVFYNYGWWFVCRNYNDLLDYKMGVEDFVWKSVLEDIGTTDYYNWDKYKNQRDASIAHAILTHGKLMVEKKQIPISISESFIDLYNYNLENQINVLSKGSHIYINKNMGWNFSGNDDIYELRDEIKFYLPDVSDIKIIKLENDCYEAYLRTALIRNKFFDSFLSYQDAHIVSHYLYLKDDKTNVDNIPIIRKYGFLE